MRRIISIMLSLIIALMPVTSLGNTGRTKTYNFSGKNGYKIISVLVNGVNQGAITTWTFSNMLGGKQNIKVVAKTEDEAWNAPVLGEGLVPVNWNGTTWVETTVADWDYNYSMATANHGTVAGDGTAKWANAMMDADGDGVLESSFVWIPRYTYKITSGYHSSGNSWSSVDNPGTNKIEIKFSNGTEDNITEGATNASEGYIKHPAFTFGDDELTGIWIAKYEASRNDAGAGFVGQGTQVTSRPGVVAWTNINVSDMYNYAYNINRELDSHLMKNNEWGAVAYLTNAIGKIPYINNRGYVTGNSGGTQDESEGNTAYAWNTEGGVRASTTHNVYGIYDLSGGSSEYVSAYVDNGDSHLSNYAGVLVANKNTKYVEVYPMGNSDTRILNYEAWANINGDAVYETSSSGDTNNSSWDGDCSYAPYSSGPLFKRGGFLEDTSRAGIFQFYFGAADNDRSNGFRPVLAVKQAWTVTFDANGGTGTMEPQSFAKGVTQNLTANAFTREGYVFKGWSTTPTGTKEFDDQQSYLPTNNITLYAIWRDLYSYTVTFDANDGSGTVATQTFTEGTAQNLTANTFTRNGYTFAGWSTTPTGSVAYADKASYTATANATLYAVWSTDSYTITYNLDGGSVTGNPTTYNVTSANITLINPTKTGYTFTGWTGSNGATPSTTVTIAKGSTGNKTYTATWTANTYTVTFNANGGTGTMSQQSFTHGVAKNLTTNAFTKAGYTFEGWATTASGMVAYADKASYTATANATLYAKWTANTYTVKYNGNGNTGGSTASSTHTYDVAKNLTANGFTKAYTVTYNHNYTGSTNTTKTGTYSFGGWATTASGAVAHADKASVTNLATSGTVNLYAKWTGGSVTYVPTRTGYTFGGWYKEASCINQLATSNGTYTPTANITLYAKWTIKTYSVTYNANGGTGTMSNQTFTHGVAKNLTTNTFTAPEGKLFAGWSTTSNGEVEYADGAEFSTTSNVTLYAVWKERISVYFSRFIGSLTVTAEDGSRINGYSGAMYVLPGSVIKFEDNYTGITNYYFNGRRVYVQYNYLEIVVNSEVKIDEGWGYGIRNVKEIKITSESSTVK